MSISTMLTAITTAVTDAGVKAFPYEGQFGDADLKRVNNQAPCVYLSCVGLSDTEDQGDDMIGTGQWVASIVTARTKAGDNTASRLDGATAIAETILPLIRDSNGSSGAWADECAGPARKIRARNVFSADLDKKGLTLWVMTWEQDVSLVAFDNAALDDLLTVHATFTNIEDEGLSERTTTLEGAS